MSTTEATAYGRGWAFPLGFDLDAGVAMVDGAQDIEQALEILFRTQPGERIMRSAFGCGLNEFIFARIDEELKTQISAMIAEGIRRYEPRVTVLSVMLAEEGLNNNALRVTVEYAHELGGGAKQVEWRTSLRDSVPGGAT